jgi:hypothetical protein
MAVKFKTEPNHQPSADKAPKTDEKMAKPLLSGTKAGASVCVTVVCVTTVSPGTTLGFTMLFVASALLFNTEVLMLLLMLLFF